MTSRKKAKRRYKRKLKQRLYKQWIRLLAHRYLTKVLMRPEQVRIETYENWVEAFYQLAAQHPLLAAEVCDGWDRDFPDEAHEDYPDDAVRMAQQLLHPRTKSNFCQLPRQPDSHRPYWVSEQAREPEPPPIPCPFCRGNDPTCEVCDGKGEWASIGTLSGFEQLYQHQLSHLAALMAASA